MSVIMLSLAKRESDFVNYSYDYRINNNNNKIILYSAVSITMPKALNWTPLNPITITNYRPHFCIILPMRVLRLTPFKRISAWTRIMTWMNKSIY